MIKVRKSTDRGFANLVWLTTYHSFSFNDYHDPRYTHFRMLRVLNEDHVQPGKGFEEHFHRDMEIITYVYAGEIEHKDSLGNSGVIRAGDVQRMSAGSGIMHSEFNPSREEILSLLQIWIFPDKKGITPEYEQKHFPPDERVNRLRLIVSDKGDKSTLSIHQEFSMYDCLLRPGHELTHQVSKGNALWLQLIRGDLFLEGSLIHAGDGASVENLDVIRLRANNEAHFVLLELS